jgi:hypothetical protein
MATSSRKIWVPEFRLQCPGELVYPVRNDEVGIEGQRQVKKTSAQHLADQAVHVKSWELMAIPRPPIHLDRGHRASDFLVFSVFSFISYKSTRPRASAITLFWESEKCQQPRFPMSQTLTRVQRVLMTGRSATNAGGVCMEHATPVNERKVRQLAHITQ